MTTPIGHSPAWLSALRSVELRARHGRPLLLLGPSGAGKEVLADVYADAAKRPLVAVNCAALSDSLLESELFGHARGAFTDAHAARRGLFEEADDGILFLDEIHGASPRLQVALLRVIESGWVRPVGGRPVQVDVRVIAASSSPDPRAAIRPDLWWRLVGPGAVRVPGLAERREDVDAMAQAFLERVEAYASLSLASATIAELRARDYSDGEVRALWSLVDAAALAALDEETTVIEVRHLAQRETNRPSKSTLSEIAKELDEGGPWTAAQLARIAGVSDTSAKRWARTHAMRAGATKDATWSLPGHPQEPQ